MELMRFTLIYDGPLKAQSKGDCRTDAKHAIREAFHKQLVELWNERVPLRRALDYYKRFGPFTPRAQKSSVLFEQVKPPSSSFPRAMQPAGAELDRAIAQMDAQATAQKRGILVAFDRKGFQFVPLVTGHFDLVCELDILFLRAEPPGTLFTNTRGDLDNRLKTLFDALCVPKPEQLPQTWEPSDHQRPFFCLLEDDKLVTAIRVESERLLDEPQESSRVKLVIRATMKTRRVSLVTLDIEGD